MILRYIPIILCTAADAERRTTTAMTCCTATAADGRFWPLASPPNSERAISA